MLKNTGVRGGKIPIGGIVYTSLLSLALLQFYKENWLISYDQKPNSECRTPSHVLLPHASLKTRAFNLLPRLN